MSDKLWDKLPPVTWNNGGREAFYEAYWSERIKRGYDPAKPEPVNTRSGMHPAAASVSTDGLDVENIIMDDDEGWDDL